MPDLETSFSDPEFITQELKKQNKGLYLCSLYFDEGKRLAAQNIFSFFLELKKIPSTISEPMLGEIRTTWWHEAIEAGDTKNIGAPLARQIIETIDRFKLNKDMFNQLLEGITQDLYIETYATQKDLDAFFDKTYGSYFSILQHINSSKIGTSNTHISAGRALGYATSLYETPIALQRGTHYFPEDVLKRLSSSSEEVYSRIYSKSIAHIVDELAQTALSYLNTANEEIKSLENEIKPAFTPLAQIRPMLKMIHKTDNPLTQITPLSPLGFQWHLWKCARSGQF